jgi:hypothetical protein
MIRRRNRWDLLGWPRWPRWLSGGSIFPLVPLVASQILSTFCQHLFTRWDSDDSAAFWNPENLRTIKNPSDPFLFIETVETWFFLPHVLWLDKPRTPVAKPLNLRCNLEPSHREHGAYTTKSGKNLMVFQDFRYFFRDEHPQLLARFWKPRGALGVSPAFWPAQPGANGAKAKMGWYQFFFDILDLYSY